MQLGKAPGGPSEDLSLPQQRYVEVIAELIREKGRARMNDVATRLAVKPPSASEAVKRLTTQGLTTRASRFQVGLTARGRRVAARLDRRHAALRAFVGDVLAIDRAAADALACRVEHCVDTRFTDRLLALVEILVRRHPAALADIVSRMRRGGGGGSPGTTAGRTLQRRAPRAARTKGMRKP